MPSNGKLPTPYHADEESGVTLYCADCLDVLPALHPHSQVVLVTDPPFLQDGGISYEHPGVSDRASPTTTIGTPWGFSLDWIRESHFSVSPKHWVVFCNYRMLGEVLIKIETCTKLGCVFSWRKSNAPLMARPVPRLDCEFIVWARHRDANCARMGEFKSMVIDVPLPQAGCMADERIVIDGGKAAHPCQKPIAVVLPFVDRLADKGDIVVDPFCGTGTTLLAAKQLGLRAIGIERSEDYCRIAVNRLRQGVLFGAGAGGKE